MCRSHLAIFLVSSRGNCSVYSYRFTVPMEGCDVRSLLCHYIGTELPFFFPYISLKFGHPLSRDLFALGCVIGNLPIGRSRR